MKIRLPIYIGLAALIIWWSQTFRWPAGSERYEGIGRSIADHACTLASTSFYASFPSLPENTVVASFIEMGRNIQITAGMVRRSPCYRGDIELICMFGCRGESGDKKEAVKDYIPPILSPPTPVIP
jgi:hypothetical protein